MKTSKKGISLIVLIITILVMIIISAAVILYLDDSKVIKNAKKAVTMNNVSVAKEVVTVARAEWRTNQEKIKDDGYKTFVKYAEYKLEEAGFIIGTNGGEVEVSENGLLYAYVQPIIPEGYIASDIDGEDTVAEGLVIYEGDETVSKDEDAQTTRNQFVWVPVPNMTEFVRKDWGVPTNAVSFDKLTSYNLDSAEEAVEYNAMKESVAKYGGFYIARYEAGNDNGNVVSKKNVATMTTTANVGWNESKEKAESFTSYSIVSHLIYDEEWDAALTFISKQDPLYPNNSLGKGWYSDNYSSGNPNHLTGIDVGETATNKLNNIYDMAGNMYEYTNAFYNSTRRVVRGGAYGHTGVNGPAGFRKDSSINGETVTYRTFRVALYLK